MPYVLLLLLLLLSACGSDGGSANASLDGSYTGTLSVGGQPVAPFTLTAAQTGQAVSGTWTGGGRTGTFAANVNGSQFAGVLSGGGLLCNTTGIYDDEQLSGTLACAGGGTGAFAASRL